MHRCTVKYFGWCKVFVLIRSVLGFALKVVLDSGGGLGLPISE